MSEEMKSAEETQQQPDLTALVQQQQAMIEQLLKLAQPAGPVSQPTQPGLAVQSDHAQLAQNEQRIDFVIEWLYGRLDEGGKLAWNRAIAEHLSRA